MAFGLMSCPLVAIPAKGGAIRRGGLAEPELTLTNPHAALSISA